MVLKQNTHLLEKNNLYINYMYTTYISPIYSSCSSTKGRIYIETTSFLFFVFLKKEL